MTTNLTAPAELVTKKGHGHNGALLKSIAFVVTCVVGVVILFFLVEGFSSTVVVIRDYVAYRDHGPDMVHSTQFDPELGWVNIPNLDSKDFYGPGVFLQTNANGFRNREEFPRQVPAAKLRVLCAGDSFTFGVGVDNDHTWCRQLSSQDHRLEAVNMGVPGYGADQIYLFQLREASQIDYDVQIFAVITEDLGRSTRANFAGYGKPVLELRGDELVVTHVPVKKASAFSRVTYWLPNLRSVGLLQKVLPASRSSSEATLMDTRTAHAVTARMLENLQAANRSRNRVTVVLILPTTAELSSLDSGAPGATSCARSAPGKALCSSTSWMTPKNCLRPTPAICSS